MTTKTEIRKAELIKLITSYIVEYADCRDELSANKTAEVIYGVVLHHDRTLPAPIDDKVIADNMRDYWNHLGRED